MKEYLRSIAFLLLLSSCGHPTLNTKEDAVSFLETHKFLDENATISGSNGGKLKSAFSMHFNSGNAIINGESMTYTIEETSDGGSHFGGPGFIIQFCGSQKYAYGGCIKGYLSAGLKSDGSRSKNGSSLLLEGAYIRAFFSYLSNESITKK